MADIEKNESTAVEASEKKEAKKKPSVFKKMGKFFREYKSELKKVVWATPKQTLNNFILVAVSVVVTGLGIGVLDLIFNKGLTELGKLL